MYTSTKRDIKLSKFQEETAVIYVRVSNPKQVSNYSIPTQVEACRNYLFFKGVREVGIFIEEGESAKSRDRHQLQNLMYFLSQNQGKVNFILVYKIDRWARSQLDYYAIKATLVKYKCRLLSVTENIDETPVGNFLEGIFANVAQFDNQMKAERTKACLLTKALSGDYPVYAPYG